MIAWLYLSWSNAKRHHWPWWLVMESLAPFGKTIRGSKLNGSFLFEDLILSNHLRRGPAIFFKVLKTTCAFWLEIFHRLYKLITCFTKFTSPIQRTIPSVASVFNSKENDVRWRMDFVSLMGNDKYPLPSNIGRVMSVSDFKKMSCNAFYNHAWFLSTLFLDLIS